MSGEDMTAPGNAHWFRPVCMTGDGRDVRPNVIVNHHPDLPPANLFIERGIKTSIHGQMDKSLKAARRLVKSRARKGVGEKVPDMLAHDRRVVKSVLRAHEPGLDDVETDVLIRAVIRKLKKGGVNKTQGAQMMAESHSTGTQFLPAVHTD